MKLLLINPSEKESIGFSKHKFLLNPPLSLAYLAALTPDNWDIEIIDENFDNFRIVDDADLVAITSFTCTVRRGYEIAQIYKDKKIPTIMGGIHVSMMADEALKYCDSVVIGEAEKVWPKLIEDFINNNLKRKYFGEWGSLEGMLKPKREILNKKYYTGVIQTSRGCPYNCDFCTVTQFNGRKYRMRPVEEVLDELETIPQKDILFLDDNLIGCGKKHRERAKELFRGIIKRKIKKRLFAQVTTDFADDEELLELSASSGCRGMFTGIEAINNNILESINKRINLNKNIEYYKNSFIKAQKYGINIIGAFMVGNDDEGDHIFNRIEEFAKETNLSVIQFSFITPFPGTKLWERLESQNRIIVNDFPKDWTKYDFGNIVFKTKVPSELIYQKAIEFIFRVHTWKGILARTFTNLKYSKSLTSGIHCLILNIVYRKLYLSFTQNGMKEHWSKEALIQSELIRCQ